MTIYFNDNRLFIVRYGMSTAKLAAFIRRFEPLRDCQYEGVPYLRYTFHAETRCD